MLSLIFYIFISFFVVSEVVRVLFELFSYRIQFMSKLNIILRVVYIVSLTLSSFLLLQYDQIK